MEIGTRERRKRLFVMGKGNICTMTEVIILETGSRGRWKDRDNLSMLMAIWYTRGNGKMITMRGKADLWVGALILPSTKESSEEEGWRVSDRCGSTMEEGSKVSSETIYPTAKVVCS